MLKELLYRLHLRPDPTINAIADRLGAPDEYVVCPHCGAQDWRVPPHGLGEPCPVVEKMADSAGLKFDAERMNTIRAGHQMETLQRFLEEHFAPPDSDEEEA